MSAGGCFKNTSVSVRSDLQCFLIISSSKEAFALLPSSMAHACSSTAMDDMKTGRPLTKYPSPLGSLKGKVPGPSGLLRMLSVRLHSLIIPSPVPPRRMQRSQTSHRQYRSPISHRIWYQELSFPADHLRGINAPGWNDRSWSSEPDCEYFNKALLLVR